MTAPSTVSDIPPPALVLDAAIMQANIERMAEFCREGDVKLRPPFQATTYALWLGPAAMLLLGFVGTGVYMRRQSRRATDAAPLDDDERRRLDSLLDDG